MKYLTLPARCLIFLFALSLQIVAQERAAGNVVDSGVAPPIKLTAVPVNTGRKTTGSWLTEPLVQVENTSSKIIQYMVIEITLPDAKPTTNGPLMLAYGQPPGTSSFNVIESLQPGMKGRTTPATSCSATHVEPPRRPLLSEAARHQQRLARHVLRIGRRQIDRRR